MFPMTINKKRVFTAALIIAASLLLVFYGATLPGRSLAAESGDFDDAPKKTLHVSGQGTVYASPDIAYITLGVVTEDANAKAAQQANAEAMSKIVASIKSAGIDSKDIKTVNYSIYPKYNFVEKTGESRIVGYTVNNSVQVTVRDIAKVGAVIDIAAENGMNTSSSISFGLSDYEKHYHEALANAAEAASKKAQTIAKTLGITLKGPVSITESGGYEPVYAYNRVMDMKAEMASTPVEAGTLSVKSSVSIVYEY